MKASIEVTPLLEWIDQGIAGITKTLTVPIDESMPPQAEEFGEFLVAALAKPFLEAFREQILLRATTVDDGVSRIAEEREKRLLRKSTAQDAVTHSNGALARTAAQIASGETKVRRAVQPRSPRIEDLATAGALIAAEIDRLLLEEKSRENQD